VGAEGLHLALREVGVEDPAQADFVVVGEGPGLDYASLTRGINLIVKQGARLVATNPDVNVDATIDGQHRLVPGGGALVAPFAVASGVQPVIIGKPHPLLFEMALEQLGCEPEHCLMIGDRPDTDIAGAGAIGMKTALVRTGRFAPGEPWPDGLPRPDWDAGNLEQLLQQPWFDGFDGRT
jgi:HAD superfamily hydrolase (TIGR01450 family)